MKNTNLAIRWTLLSLFFVSLQLSAQDFDPHLQQNELETISRHISDLESEALSKDGTKRLNLADAYFQRYMAVHDQADAIRALNIYKDLASKSLDNGVVKFSDKISLIYQLNGDLPSGRAYFEDLLQNQSLQSSSELYKVNVDYADLLNHFQQDEAGRYYELASGIHDNAPGEALYKWIRYLIQKGELKKAEQLILDVDERLININHVLLGLLKETRELQGEVPTETTNRLERLKSQHSNSFGQGRQRQGTESKIAVYRSRVERYFLTRPGDTFSLFLID